MNTIRVHTAQNVTLEYHIASVGDRIIATVLDNIILFSWIIAWGMALVQLEPNGQTVVGSPSIVKIIIFGFIIGVPYVFYHLVCEVFFNGQSLGKKARNIKVIRLDGTAPSLGDYLLRWLLRLVDIAAFSGLVAIITIVVNGKGQRLGDLAAGTTVVSTRALQQPAPPSLASLEALSNYQVVFPQAALLADHDVATIHQILAQATHRQNEELLYEVARKIKELTGIHTNLPDGAFLQTVLRDHAYLATR